MASSQNSSHARSNSLPCKPHPLVSQINLQICRLRDSQATSTSSTPSSILAHSLLEIHDIHELADKVIQLPLVQQALSQDQNKKLEDELLDGSLRLLDACNIAKDALLHTKECVLDLRSILRRRQGSEKCFALEVKKYLTSRQIAKKTIKRALKNLACLEIGKSALSSINETNNNENMNLVSVISTLRDVEAITSSTLKYLMFFISGDKAPFAKSSRWSLVSKLIMHHKRVDPEDKDANEFAIVDVALESPVNVHVDNVQSRLKNLESCIQDLERGIEPLFRRMIKNRVSLLNTLN